MTYEDKDAKQEGTVHVEDTDVLEKDRNDSLGSDQLGSGEEPAESLEARKKRVLRKLDFRILSFLGLLYAVSLVDRTNLSSARIGGMDKELRL